MPRRGVVLGGELKLGFGVEEDASATNVVRARRSGRLCR